MVVALICCNLAIADVGNNNRYSSGGGDYGGGDSDVGVLIGYLIGLMIENPTMGLIVLVILIVFVLISRRKAKKHTYINNNVNQQAENDFTFDNTAMVAEQIRAIDPRVTLVAAGGINPQNAADYAATGVDGLATTALYTAKPLDMSVRMEAL